MAAASKAYRRLKPLPSVLDPFKGILDKLILDDDLAPRKQRHTAMKLFHWLKHEHNFTGSYERVRLYVRGQERERRETFIPLDHDPDQRTLGMCTSISPRDAGRCPCCS